MTDRTPTGDLRERIVSALVEHARQESHKKGIKLSRFLETTIRAGAEARADAVLPVVLAARPDKPRIVVHESDACQGNITGWTCDDCEDGDCEHECHDTEPTGDLRERLAEALGDTIARWWQTPPKLDAAADAVMHVIEPAMLAITVDATQRADELAARLAEAETARARASCCEDGDRTYAEMERHLAQRAEEAERKHAEAVAQIAAEHRGKLAAEAAVRRVRQALARKTLLAGPRAEKAVRVADVEAALDAEQPSVCCDLHGLPCEPPSELCCRSCTEANHPQHPAGVRCVLDQPEETR